MRNFNLIELGIDEQQHKSIKNFEESCKTKLKALMDLIDFLNSDSIERESDEFSLLCDVFLLLSDKEFIYELKKILN